MSYADCVSRMSAIDTLLRRVDSSWQSLVPSSTISGTAISAGSPFSGVLQTVAGSTSTVGSADFASVNVLGSSGVDAVYGDLLAPDPGNPRELTRVSASDALAAFDKVADQIPYADEIRQAALDNGIDPLLLVALVKWESNFGANARSRVGAMGLTQLMPGTARELGVEDAWDPLQNLEGGAKYLGTQLERFGRVDMAVASYNAGPGAVAQLGKVPDNKWRYVNGIIGVWQRWRAAAA